MLDCDGDPQRTGKALGTDLLDGTTSLPLLLAARSDLRSLASALREPVVAGGRAAAPGRAWLATGALDEVRDYRRQVRATRRGRARAAAAPALRHSRTASASCGARSTETPLSLRRTTRDMATIDRTIRSSPGSEKVLAGERLDFDDGVALLESDDILAVGRLADTARRLRGGNDEVFFVNNLYLNHTNVCRVKCKFCAFARTGKQEGAYLHDIGDLVQHALEVTRPRSSARSTWSAASIRT